MFTGIIEAAGKVDSIEHGPDGGRLRVSLADAPAIAHGMKLGDSISVNGCCLTVAEFAADHFFRRSFRRKRCAARRSAKGSPAIP